MRLGFCLLLAAALPVVAEELDGVVRVSPFSDAVEVVDRSGRAWRIEGRAAERLATFEARRIRVETRLGQAGRARVERILSPNRLEIDAVPRADSEDGPIQLELEDGRRLKAVGPAAQTLWRGLDRQVHVRVWLFTAGREVWVDAVRATACADAVLRRSPGLTPGMSWRFPVNRVTAGAEVWVRGSREDGMLLVQPRRGPSGEIEQEKLVFSDGEPIPRHAESMPATSLRQQLEGMVPGEE